MKLLKKILGVLFSAWMFVGKLMGHLVNTILLCALYCFVLTPVALIKRMFGQPGLLLKNNKQSYFKERSHLFTAEDMKQLW